jgi:hypothetical protein
MYQEVRRPWYDIDDEWSLFAGMSPEGIAARQQELISMGALEGNEVVFGYWGEAEATVTSKMMNIANGNALKIEDFGDDFWKNHWKTVKDATTPKRPVFSSPSYRRLDPASAQLTVEETIRRTLGRDASSEELADLGAQLTDMHRQSFVADVDALRNEFNSQVLANDTGDPTAAGAVPDVDWEAQFLTKFQESHKVELARWDRTQDANQRQQLVGGALSNFMSQLGGGIGK